MIQTHRTKLFHLSLALLWSACSSTSGADDPSYPSGGSAGARPTPSSGTGGNAFPQAGTDGVSGAHSASGSAGRPATTSGGGGSNSASGGSNSASGGTGAQAGKSTSGGTPGTAGTLAMSGGRLGSGGTPGTAGTGTAGTAGTGTAGGGTTGPIKQPSDPCAPRAGYRNMFAEVLGKSDAEISAKLDAGFQQLFHGTGEQPVYYEVGTDEAYILDVNNNDVRSEGISYGMTIAVQMNKQTEFNRIYKWARRVMYQGGTGVYGWQAGSNGQLIASGSAPDGEEYIAMALILAARRWGDTSGSFNYAADARALLDAQINRGHFNRSNHLIGFLANSGYSDPSYVLPAFYEVWACFDTKNQQFWKSAVTAGRQHLQRACNANTGLAPYLSNWDGSPYSGGPDFNSDSWRVVGNIMMDHHLFGADAWQTTFAQKFAAFFKVQQVKRPMPDEFQINGTPTVTHDDPAKGLIAQNAMVSFGVPAADGKFFLEELWNLPIPAGRYRYYDGLLYMLAFLHSSGRFHLEFQR